MDGFEEEGEPKLYASIKILVKRIKISKDSATILLILYEWNEHKFNGARVPAIREV